MSSKIKEILTIKHLKWKETKVCLTLGGVNIPHAIMGAKSLTCQSSVQVVPTDDFLAKQKILLVEQHLKICFQVTENTQSTMASIQSEHNI